jgi:hypothetical protein
VQKNGVAMLRATSPSEFVLTLDAPLPQDFTILVELVPKSCCAPEDLGLEGTATLSESAGSAHLLWHTATQIVLGGGERYEGAVPESLRDALPGQLTRIVVVFQGNTVRMYTNGRRLYTLTDRRFVRGRVLRVFLGGQNSGTNAVPLAGLRVVEGIHPRVSPAPAVVAFAPTDTVAPVTRPPADEVRRRTDSVTPVPPQPPPPPPPPPADEVRRRTDSVTPVAPPPAAPMTRAGETGEVTQTGSTPPAGFTTLAPRTIGLGGLTVTGVSSTMAPRTIALSGLTVTGVASTMAPRTIALSGLIVTGSSSTLAPREFVLDGLVVTGVSTTLAPRTIALTGLSVVGVTP